MSGAVHGGDRQSVNEWPQFLRGLISNPRSVASVFPSSRPLARRIAQQVDPTAVGCVLELGPGTGVVTQALLERGVQPSRLVLLEADPKFVEFLRRRFPHAKLLCGDALEFEPAALDQPIAAIVSGLPLLNFEEGRRRAFIDRGLNALAAGGPLVQLSFGWTPPVPSGPRRAIRSAGIEFRNCPPASVWVYSQAPTPLGSSTIELSSSSSLCIEAPALQNLWSAIGRVGRRS